MFWYNVVVERIGSSQRPTRNKENDNELRWPHSQVCACNRPYCRLQVRPIMRWSPRISHSPLLKRPSRRWGHRAFIAGFFLSARVRPRKEQQNTRRSFDSVLTELPINPLTIVAPLTTHLRIITEKIGEPFIRVKSFNHTVMKRRYRMKTVIHCQKLFYIHL